ncbi:MAG: glycogen/starch synthase [Gammaproteobacteria bacterium]|nr:glycogen/starch synthase [Gammaproteobacteria bacterium]MBT8104331.1 glycogen/starch synthase [Gammaproteobacteria bacterium]NNK24347.1 glycosyltransferase [Woeseiaceae bacterium]NNL63615.1 glycosyltransferase [Woeseiaceae bacterium]
MGGVGDVMRDLPLAIARQGWQVTMATPSYGSLHLDGEASRLRAVDVAWRGSIETVEVWSVPGDNDGVRNLAFDHPLFAAAGAGRIYVSDEDARPFASDANRLALFCAAAAEWVRREERRPDVVHLHDWHAALYLLFARFDPRYEALDAIPTVFTIHNLSYQGTRPLSGDESSLASWFPDLDVDLDAVADPVHEDCINPLAVAIRLADRISTVSATYADEICRPSDAAAGFIGGEGLEQLLAGVRDEGRLVGILNGCEYDLPRTRRHGWARLLDMFAAQLHDWQQRDPDNEAHGLALQRIEQLPKRKPRHVVTSIGRLVAQKATLLLHGDDAEGSPLERLAESLGRSAAFVILGSGERRFESRLLAIARKHPKLLFLNGYSEVLADPLYASGDLFLMPSSFEPCGISQMLAMRSGQPCVVHGVGGLRDTVRHGVTGFVFDGDTADAQADDFVAATRAALALRAGYADSWKAIRRRAKAQRFSWELAAQRTIDELYRLDHE